jgi:hypothetical protein
MKYYSAIKNEIMIFSGKWVELEIITLSKINQTQKDIYYVFSLRCGICISGGKKNLNINGRLFGWREPVGGRKGKREGGVGR